MVRNASQFSSSVRVLAAAPVAVIEGAVPALRAVLAWLVHWDDLARQRRDLSRLDDRQLQDVGISRQEAERESRRWSAPWRAPYGPR